MTANGRQAVSGATLRAVKAGANDTESSMEIKENEKRAKLEDVKNDGEKGRNDTNNTKNAAVEKKRQEKEAEDKKAEEARQAKEKKRKDVAETNARNMARINSEDTLKTGTETIFGDEPLDAIAHGVKHIEKVSEKHTSASPSDVIFDGN